MAKTLLNKDEVWISISDAAHNKSTTRRVITKAIEKDRLDAVYIKEFKKESIFVIVNKKYKQFSSTSKHRLDINALIAFTNKRLRGKV